MMSACHAHCARAEQPETNRVKWLPWSEPEAGLVPAPRLSSATQEVLAEKQIRIERREPRRLNAIDLIGFDLIVNLSGYALPNTSAEVITVSVPDPAGQDKRRYRQVRDRIEEVVESLIAHLRDARRRIVSAAPSCLVWVA